MLINGIGDFRNLLEDDMRRVRRDNSEIRSSARELLDFTQEKCRHPWQIVRFHELNPLRQIDAVNDELRIATVALSFAIHRDEVLVVVDRALGPHTADHAKSFHSGRSIKNAVANQSAFGSSSASSTVRTPRA